MIKNYFIITSIFILLLTLSAGCTNTNEKAATISVHSDSEYVNTFEDLHLGILFDFDFTLPDADKRWVNLWVERYIDGEKESQPLTQLSYGNSPTNVEHGHLGFGMIHTSLEDTLVFLYGPGVSTHPTRIEKTSNTDVISSWDYAIGNEKVELESDETKILAVYRETESSTIRTVDLQDEDSVNEIIKQDNMVLLLKVKIEEEHSTPN